MYPTQNASVTIYERNKYAVRIRNALYNTISSSYHPFTITQSLSLVIVHDFIYYNLPKYEMRFNVISRKKTLNARYLYYHLYWTSSATNVFIPQYISTQKQKNVNLKIFSNCEFYYQIVWHITNMN